MKLHSLFVLFAMCAVIGLGGVSTAHGQAAAQPALVTYKDHVSAVLRKHCINCHNPDKVTSDLNVTTYQALMTGGASGAAVAPGSPDQSLLFQVITHSEEPYMPPKQPKIPDADIALIRKWIELGAPETSAGAAKSAARKMDVDLTTVTTGKPDGPPPMPTSSLPPVNLPATARATPVTAMAASPWAPLLAVSGHERILLYNTGTLELLGTLPFPERSCHVLKFSRNGKLLLAAGGHSAESGKVVLFDVATGKRVTEIGDELDAVLAADITANQKYVALGGPSKILKIYETESGQLRHRIKKHTDWVTALEFSPDAGLLCSGDRAGNAYVWEVETGGIVFTLGDHKDAITGISWRADSQMVATASEDGKLILWYAEDGFPTRTLTPHTDGNRSGPRNKTPGVLGVEYARSGIFATVGRDQTARIWKADGNQQAKLTGFTDIPTKVVLSHDGDRVFAGDYTGTIRVWSVKDQKPAGELSTNPK